MSYTFNVVHGNNSTSTLTVHGNRLKDVFRVLYKNYYHIEIASDYCTSSDIVNCMDCLVDETHPIEIRESHALVYVKPLIDEECNSEKEGW